MQSTRAGRWCHRPPSSHEEHKCKLFLIGLRKINPISLPLASRVERVVLGLNLLICSGSLASPKATNRAVRHQGAHGAMGLVRKANIGRGAEKEEEEKRKSPTQRPAKALLVVLGPLSPIGISKPLRPLRAC